MAFEVNKSIKLYAPDGNHATGLGSYLNACVFFAMLTGESPERPPATRESKRDQQLRQLEQAAAKAVANRTSQDR